MTSSATDPALGDRTGGEPGGPSGRPARRAGQAALSVGLFAVVVAIAFESISVATAMPEAARELDGLDLYAWAFSLFLIGQLFATVAAGRLSDRIGPGRPIAGGLALFAVGLLVAASSSSMIMLIGGRLLQGLGGGSIAVAMYVVLAQYYRPESRPRMFSLISTAWVLPSFLGPTVSSWLTHHLGWRAVFWSVLPLAAFGALLLLPRILGRRAAIGRVDGPEPDAATEDAATQQDRPVALWAAALAPLGAAGIQFAGQHPTVVGLLIGAAGVVAVGLSLPSLMPRGFFRFRPGLPPVIVVRTLMVGAFFGAEAFVPLMLVQTRDVSLLLAGSVLTVGAIGWTTGSFVQARSSLPFARQTIITLGTVSLLLGLALLAAVTWLDLWFGLVAVAWVFSGLGMGLATASTSLATMTLSFAREQGRNASSLQFGDAFGGGLFIGVSGTIFAALRSDHPLTGTFGWVFTAMIVVALGAVLVSLRVGPIRPVE